jgi:hypothetical protein
MTKKVLTDWMNIPESFSPEAYEGFVYLVVNTITKQQYVGRKYFWSKTKVKVKGSTRRKLKVKESDWRYYKSSSDELKADIETFGLAAFEFSILSLHETRAETNYTEVKEQFVRDVLYAVLPSGEYAYLNKCILNRYYRKKT